MARRTLADEIQMSRPFGSPAVEAYLNLLRTGDLLQHQLGRLFRQRGLTQQQYNVLRILRGAGPEGLPSLEIGHRMVTRVPDITRLVDRMERAGLVHRRRWEQDRRVVRVTLTPEGRRLTDALEGPANELHRRQFGHLDDEELRTLNTLLEKIRAHAGDGDE